MWELTKFRIRAHIKARLEARLREQQKLKNAPSLRVRRAGAELRVIDGLAMPADTVQARVILNDLTPRGIKVFSTQPFIVGQKVALTLDHPKRIYVRGHVVACQEVQTTGHILSTQHFAYRLYLKFTFHSVDEQLAMKAYCDEIRKTFGIEPYSALAVSPTSQ